jgi:hypothetical protein
MSLKISALTTVLASALTGTDYLPVATGTTGNKKLLVTSLLPTLAEIGHTTPQYLLDVITSTNAINQKGLTSANSILTVTADTSGSDKNILLTVVEAAIDLANCDNSTSLFLASVDLATNVTGVLPVLNGGTGSAAAWAAYSILGSPLTQDGPLDSHQMIADGVLLIGGASGPQVATLTAGDNVTITNAAGGITINAYLSILLGNLDAGGNNINLGSGWVSFNGGNTGLYFPSAGAAYIGDGTPFSDSSLNVETGLTFAGGKAQTLEVAASGSPALFTLKGSDGNADGVNAGGVTLQAGSATGNAAGGILKLMGGDAVSAGFAGQVHLGVSVAGSETIGIVLDSAGNVIVDSGLLTIKSPTSGLAQTDKSTVTQLTSHSTTVAATGGSGVITLAAVVLNAGTQAEFTVTNPFVTATSMINLTVEGPGISSEPVNSLIIAQVASLGAGSFKIVLSNIGSADTDSGARKIHYLVVQ